MNKQIPLKEIAELFLKLGFTGFGGPAAHIAMMREEVVKKRKWLSEQHFLDLVGISHLIPGPNSTELAIYIGKEKAGRKGLLVAGICFILPAILITGIFAILYKQYGQIPKLQGFIYGIKPAIIAVILAAVFPLAKKSLKSTELIVLGILTLVGSLLKLNEIYLMFGAGFYALIHAKIKTKNWTKIILPISFFQINSVTLTHTSTIKLFLLFLKIGAVLYGSGYVLFAFLDSELVSRGITSRHLLIDAIAVGQITPGPVFSSVTFIGYQINGITGATAATIGIFLPSFIFIALLNPIVKKLKNSSFFSVFLDAVNVASVSIIASACYTMGKESIEDWKSLSIAIVSLAMTFGFNKINSTYIILGGSIVGYILTLI